MLRETCQITIVKTEINEHDKINEYRQTYKKKNPTNNIFSYISHTNADL